MIIGGDKSQNESLYQSLVPLAERIWEDYLAEQKVGKHGPEDKR